MLARLVGIERRMNPPEHHRRAALARETSKVIAAQRVGGMNANAHDVARLDTLQCEGFERFIDDHGRAIVRRRGRREHI